jgi:spore maturation protein CgeB
VRVLTVAPGPSFSVADVHRGWVKAFEQLGVDVVDFNLGDALTFYERSLEALKIGRGEQAAHLASRALRAMLYDFWPDWLFITSGFFVAPLVYEIARKRGVKIALLCTESPYEDDQQVKRAPFVDLMLTNDPTNLDRFREYCPAEYVPHAYDPDIHHPGTPEPDLACDFAFVGTGYPSRIEFFEKVDWTGLDVTLAGNWPIDDTSPLAPFTLHQAGECVDNTDAARLYRSAKVSANLYRREAERPELEHGYALGPRDVEMAACGLFYLRDSRPESDELLPMLPVIGTPHEFGEQVRWWATHDREREAAAAMARAALADRTFDRNVRTFLRLTESI